MKAEALVSDIQRCSFDDGPGIRTTVFFKGCNLHCPWCHNPETIPRSRVLLYAQDRCVHCGICAIKCPEKLELPLRGEVSCSGCRGCVCPEGALRVSGRTMTAEQICDVIIQDRDFYASSGGGVTLSGGEPLLQWEICLQIADFCHKNGIHVLLDTAGCADAAVFDSVAEAVDEFYFDFKLPPELYGSVCGGNFELIRRNLERLISGGRNYTLRVPLIPGYSAEPENARVMAEYAAKIGVKKVHLLPFNPLAQSKYSQMGKSYKFKGESFMDKSQLEALHAIWQEQIADTSVKE